jgi:cbb3-type cytochrome oxidase subunit 3
MTLITLARATITIVWFALFVAIWISAWSRSRRDVHAAAALLPLEESAPTLTTTEVRA